MNNYQFNLMPTHEQAAYSWMKGSYLMARQCDGLSVNLYHVDQFFVEVWYDPIKNCVDKIRSFKSRKCLEPYLEKIEIKA